MLDAAIITKHSLLGDKFCLSYYNMLVGKAITDLNRNLLTNYQIIIEVRYLFYFSSTNEYSMVVRFWYTCTITSQEFGNSVI